MNYTLLNSDVIYCSAIDTYWSWMHHPCSRANKYQWQMAPHGAHSSEWVNENRSRNSSMVHTLHVILASKSLLVGHTGACLWPVCTSLDLLYTSSSHPRSSVTQSSSKKKESKISESPKHLFNNLLELPIYYYNKKKG